MASKQNFANKRNKHTVLFQGEAIQTGTKPRKNAQELHRYPKQQAARQFTNYKQAVQDAQKQIVVAPFAAAGKMSLLTSQLGADKLTQYSNMDYGQLKQKQQELFDNPPVEPKHYGSWTPETTEQYLSAREQYNKDLASYNAERDLVSSLMSSKAAEYYNSALTMQTLTQSPRRGERTPTTRSIDRQ